MVRRRSAGRARGVVAALALAAAVAVAASACNSSGGSLATPTVASSATAAASPAAATSTATPSFQVTGSTYRFAAKGYAVDVPQGWTMKPDYFDDVAGGTFPTDVLFPNDATGAVTTSVSIECLKPNAAQATTAAFRDAQAAFLAQIGKSVSAPRPVRIGNQAGYAIDYVQDVSAGTIQVEKTDAVVLAGGCRWVISLSAPAGQRASRAAAFDAILRSMSFFPAG